MQSSGLVCPDSVLAEDFPPVKFVEFCRLLPLTSPLGEREELVSVSGENPLEGMTDSQEGEIVSLDLVELSKCRDRRHQLSTNINIKA